MDAGGQRRRRDASCDLPPCCFFSLPFRGVEDCCWCERPGWSLPGSVGWVADIGADRYMLGTRFLLGVEAVVWAW